MQNAFLIPRIPAVAHVLRTPAHEDPITITSTHPECFKMTLAYLQQGSILVSLFRLLHSCYKSSSSQINAPGTIRAGSHETVLIRCVVCIIYRSPNKLSEQLRAQRRRKLSLGRSDRHEMRPRNLTGPVIQLAHATVRSPNILRFMPRVSIRH